MRGERRTPDPNNDPCVVLAGINGMNGLLAGAGACAQQNNADAMVDFVKPLGINNKQALIDNTGVVSLIVFYLPNWQLTCLPPHVGIERIHTPMISLF